MPSQCPHGLASLLPGSDPHHPRNQTTTRKLSEFSFELEERVVLGERREYSLGLSLSESWKSVFHCNCHSILCVSLYGDAYIHFKEWYKKHLCILYLGLTWWLTYKESACNAGDPGSGITPGEGNEWQPTTVFLSGKFHGQRSLANFSPWGHKESNMTDSASLRNTIAPREQTHGASAN